ncbi:MAG: DEAD/DEAH box helicase [Pseudonocardia sp.]|nr:DEAD/DEAH box helicase [Pseudonocardia sp.]
MQLVTVDGIDTTSIRRHVDARTYVRGLAYADDRAVVHMGWNGAMCELDAVVRGSRAVDYEVTVYFEDDSGGELSFAYGECTCPVGIDCKHVVAAAIMVSRAMVSGPAAAVPAPPAPSWERGLSELLSPAGAPARARAAVPLAVEVAVSITPAALRGGADPGPRLQARLVKPGRAGWVGGGLTWSRLTAAYTFGDHDPAHVRLLQEFYALHRTRIEPGRHYYYGGEDKTIDLAAFGVRLWSFLDEAADIGLPLVHARKRHGALAPYDHAELQLDVTAGTEPGSLVIAPTLSLDPPDEDAVPVLFLGADGHGLVHVPRAAVAGNPDPAEWPLRLARLARPAPPPLQRMTLDGGRLTVPAGGNARFGTEFYPRLRHLAPVGSSDGSFTPPTISEPVLALRAGYGDGHDLSLHWEWAYAVGETPRRVPLNAAPVDDFRDTAAERAVLDALDVDLDPYGLRDDAGARLRGMDTMRFTTEVLPLLAGRPDVRVDLDGEPVTYREAGDSLRIGLSTDEVEGATDWFDLGVRISVEGREVPFADVFVALAGGESHLLLPDGAFFSLHKPQLQALRTLIEEARGLQDAPSDPLRISRFQVGLWDELRALGVVDRQARAWREQVGGLLAAEGVTPTPLPGTVAAQLRTYQREGFDWLCFLWRHRLGGILADDMGLGKTLQALALICHAKQADPGLAPFLVVAPTSVVANWAAEAARFAPDLRVVAVTDTLRRQGRDLAAVIAGADVVVTSYTLFRLDTDAYCATGWSGLVLDEAQFAKNHQSKVHQCARRLPAPFKLAITGTPMENNLMELWSLLSITAPGLFPNPRRFRDDYARPIERGTDPELLARLRRRIAPLVTRRTKEQVAPDLPPKQEQVLEVELGPQHRRIYQRHLQRERQKVLGLIDDVDRNRFTILRSLTLLRQLSLHPGLVEAAHDGLGSAKIDALCEQLAEVVAGGHRALVFSQFTGFLAHVRERLDADGVDYCYLDGSTRNRKDVIARFKDGAVPVFLISLKAGGFGLNLTEADYCFLLDPWWNPATEAQAVDRTHRIGQTRAVMAYRLIARDTIEEKVLALARRKAELFAGVMNDGNAFGSVLGADDIRELLA